MTKRTILSIFKGNKNKGSQLGIPNSLSGYCEIRVDRLVGWVSDKYGTNVASIRIDIRGRGAVIASLQALAQPEHGRFIFSHPIGGQFTGAELLKEEVIVTAHDSDGNSGRIRLDGAATLELIRDHLGISAVSCLDLDFTGGGNARPYLGAGWSGAENDFTWTENDDSYITFESPAELGTYVLRMTHGTILHKPEITSQELVVFMNTTEIAHLFYNEIHVQYRECKFSSEAFRGEVHATLRLHHPDAIRPSDVGPSQDRRRLAFNFKRLAIARLLPVTE